MRPKSKRRLIGRKRARSSPLNIRRRSERRGSDHNAAYMAQTLFPLLVNAPGKCYVQLPEGTHTIMMEKNRLMLFEAVQAFLDEAGSRSLSRC